MTDDLGLRGEPFPLISLSPSSSSSSFKSALETGAGSLRVGEGGGLISAEDWDLINGFSFLPVKRNMKKR